MSGFELPIIASASLAAGFQEHLTKPVKPDHVLRLLLEATKASGR